MTKFMFEILCNERLFAALFCHDGSADEDVLDMDSAVRVIDMYETCLGCLIFKTQELSAEKSEKTLKSLTVREREGGGI